MNKFDDFYFTEEQWNEFADEVLKYWRKKYEPLVALIDCPDEKLRKVMAMTRRQLPESLDLPIELLGGMTVREALKGAEGIRFLKATILHDPYHPPFWLNEETSQGPDQGYRFNERTGRCELNGAVGLSKGYLGECGDLTEAHFGGRHDLENRNFRGSVWVRGNGYNSVFTGSDLRNCDLREASLGEADLSGANLEDADLSKANLWKAKLVGAKLSRAKLVKTFLQAADLSGTDLETADLTGAVYDEETRLPFSFAEAYRRGMRYYFADTRGVPFPADTGQDTG